MAYEIKVQYQPSKAITAYVYGLVEGVMTQKAYIAQAGMPQVVAGSGLYANTSDIADLAAGDVVVIHDVTAGDTIIGGGEYKPEINDTTIDGIITANASIVAVAGGVSAIDTTITNNAIIATIPTIASNITTIDGYVNDIDGIITNNATITTIKAKTDKLNFNDDATTPLVLAEIGVSSGAIETTLTINDNLGNPIADATAWVTTDADGLNVVRSGVSEDHGDVVFFLTPGTYWLYARKAGYTFTPTEIVVA